MYYAVNVLMYYAVNVLMYYAVNVLMYYICTCGKFDFKILLPNGLLYVFYYASCYI